MRGQQRGILLTAERSYGLFVFAGTKGNARSNTAVMVSRNHVFHQLSALLCKAFTSRLRCSSKPSCWLFNHHVYSASSEISVHEPVARSRPTRCLPCRLKGCNVRVISNSNYQSNYPPLPPFSSNCANVCWLQMLSSGFTC